MIISEIVDFSVSHCLFIVVEILVIWTLSLSFIFDKVIIRFYDGKEGKEATRKREALVFKFKTFSVLYTHELIKGFSYPSCVCVYIYIYIYVVDMWVYI